MNDNTSLGFGYFSSEGTENAWRTVSYDGFESTSNLNLENISYHELLTMINTLQELEKKKKPGLLSSIFVKK